METCRTDLEVDEPAKDEPSWSELLAAYRSDRSQVSAAALLVRLGPWLTNARKALLAAPPFAVADIRLIYRYHVAGELREEMARRAGITPREMRRRIQRAKARARA